MVKVIGRVPGFSGGAWPLLDPTKIQPNQAFRLNNVVLDELGIASGRHGCLDFAGTIGTSLVRCISAAEFPRSGNNSRIVAHFSDGTVRTAEYGSLTAWTTLWSGLSTEPMSFVVFDNKIWCANGVDILRSWDTTTATTYASAPLFPYITVWKDTLWGAGAVSIVSLMDRAYSSEAGNGAVWPVDNFIDIGRSVGAGIIGLGADANALVVFKRAAHFALYDPVEFTNRIVDPNRGAISHPSIINKGGKLYFISEEGPALYMGDSVAQLVGIAVDSYFRHRVLDTFHQVQAYAFEDRVGWTTPLDDVTDQLQLECYTELPGTPWVFHSMPARIFVAASDQLRNRSLFGFGENANTIFTCHLHPEVTDLGAAFTSEIQTGWFDLGAEHTRKYIDRIVLRCRGDFTLDIYADYDHTTPVATHTVDGDIQIKEVVLFTDVYANHVSFRIRDTGGSVSRRQFYGTEEEARTYTSFSIASIIFTGKTLGEYR